MVRSWLVPLFASALFVPFAASAAQNPFLGNWDFDVPTHNGIGANWLGISEQNGKLDIWFQPTGGHVYQVPDYTQNGSHLKMTVAPARRNHPSTVWDLRASGGGLVGTQTHGSSTMELRGRRAPALNHTPPASWSKPEPLFDGKNLNGWVPIGNTAENHWVVRDGVLMNLQRGANLKTVRKFEDFKAHFEVSCPEESNSGFYLRGRYELQLEYEPNDPSPAERRMGSIYGRIAPSVALPPRPGQWESFDVTLVGRTVTVVRDGTLIIDHKKIDGITGGALDANEGRPGPFYIQGDHTGGLKFRNITVQVPER